MKHFLNNGVPIFCNFIDRDNSGLIFTKKKNQRAHMQAQIVVIKNASFHKCNKE